METITFSMLDEETRLGIEPASSYLYGCRFADDDDNDDECPGGDYLVNACPVTAAALLQNDNGHVEQQQLGEHPWDEDCDIPLVLLPAVVVSSLQIMGFAENKQQTALISESSPSYDADDDTSDCPTIKQGNNRKPAAKETVSSSKQKSAATTESDGESDVTATTEDEEDSEPETSTDRSGGIMELAEQQERLLRDHSRLGIVKERRTNSWFRAWWKDSHDQEPQEDEEDELVIKEPSAIVLDDCDHHGFAILDASSLALPNAFLDRNHPFQRHSSDLKFDPDDDDDLREYQGTAQKKVNNYVLLMKDCEDSCSEIEHDDDMDMIEIIDSDSEVDANEEHAVGIDDNNKKSDSAAAPCTPSPTNTRLAAALVVPARKSSLKKNYPGAPLHDRTRSKNTKNRRVSFCFPEKFAVAAADDSATAAAAATTATADAGLDLEPVIVNASSGDDTTRMPSSSSSNMAVAKWRLRQWRKRRQAHDVVAQRKVAFVKETTDNAKKNTNNEDDKDYFNSRNMKLLRRFRNRSAVKLLHDYH